MDESSPPISKFFRLSQPRFLNKSPLPQPQPQPVPPTINFLETSKESTKSEFLLPNDDCTGDKKLTENGSTNFVKNEMDDISFEEEMIGEPDLSTLSEEEVILNPMDCDGDDDGDIDGDDNVNDVLLPNEEETF